MAKLPIDFECLRIDVTILSILQIFLRELKLKLNL